MMDNWFYFRKQFVIGDRVCTVRQVGMENVAIRKKNKQYINIPRAAAGYIIGGSQAGFAPHTYTYDVQFDGFRGNNIPEYLLAARETFVHPKDTL